MERCPVDVGSANVGRPSLLSALTQASCRPHRFARRARVAGFGFWREEEAKRFVVRRGCNFRSREAVGFVLGLSAWRKAALPFFRCRGKTMTDRGGGETP